MMNPQLTLKDKVVIRLISAPECLDMREFSVLSEKHGTTFCLAGLILDESGVVLEYSPDGIAVGLEEGETLPASRWVDYERSILARRRRATRSPASPRRPSTVPSSRVMIAAKARELWAAEFGDAAAKLLPFYADDWVVDAEDLDQVTPERVLELLQAINEVANELSATLAA